MCEAAAGDFGRVRELVIGPGGAASDVLFAGGGVGGHCLPKDPWQLMQGATAWIRVSSVRRASGPRVSRRGPRYA